MTPKEARSAGWICVDCAKQHGATMHPEHIATWHKDACAVCGEEKTVTEPRDFRWPREAA